ncbi:MAG: T9SS type A sorting domain-containing protein [Bacteroidia bacterium]|nr:T9SS type A sorting domain-containing protein [Bacteroidia bacterium]
MKRILFSLILFCAISCSIAQSLSPQVISSSGTSFTNGSNQLDWTLGELSTSSLTSGSNSLSQGFHQTNLNITSIDNFDDTFGLTIFPNPSIDLLQIQFEKAAENNLIELYSTEGKLLLTQESNYATLCQIDMSKYDIGSYLIKIHNKNTKGKSYRIVKVK